MSFSMPKPEIIELDRVEIAVEPWSWEFASTRRAAIDRHFASRQRERPALWNGRVLLVHRYEIDHGVLRGACFETDYASFLAWRDWGLPDPGVFKVFAAAALRAADGAYLLGEMASSTAAAAALFSLRDAGPRGHYRQRHARSCRQPRTRAFGGNRHRHRHTRCRAGLVLGARPRLLRLDETAHGTAKRRGASLGDHAPSGERTAAGIIRRPYRAWAGGVRSADAGVRRRVPGANLAAMSGHASLAIPVAGNPAVREL
ncbi:MAG: hypothetical protein ACLPX7_14740, partial [Xanthobacteraceae bacterium]